MKATGIVRRVDDLGRIVIPKEIRRTLRIREGDPLEIYTEKDGGVIFRKYSPMGDLQDFAAQLCEAIGSNTGRIAAVSDSISHCSLDVFPTIPGEETFSTVLNPSVIVTTYSALHSPAVSSSIPETSFSGNAIFASSRIFSSLSLFLETESAIFSSKSAQTLSFHFFKSFGIWVETSVGSLRGKKLFSKSFFPGKNT